jgi:hypothetical protein
MPASVWGDKRIAITDVLKAQHVAEILRLPLPGNQTHLWLHTRVANCGNCCSALLHHHQGG